MATTAEPVVYYYQLASWNLAAAIVLPILDVVAVFLRLYTRRKQGQPLKVDDWLTIPALTLVIGAGITMIIGVAKHSVGYRTPSTPKMPVSSRTDFTIINPAITTTLQVDWAMYLICIPALGLIKLSLLSFYHRIFCPHKSGIAHIIIISMMAIVALWTISFFFTYLFICKGHFSAFWGSTAGLQAKCIYTLLVTYCFTVSDVVTDSLVLVIPLPLLWKLQLPISKKIGISLIFLLGIIAIIAASLRLSVVSKVFHKGYDPKGDEDLIITGPAYWLLVEISVALLAACLPTIRFLLKGVLSNPVVSSVRSTFSFHSLRSNRLRVYGDVTRPDTGENASTASNAGMVWTGGKIEEPALEFPMESVGRHRGVDNV